MRDLVGWQQRQQVHLNAAQVETAFRRYDTRGEGRIAATDLRRAVELLGVRPDAPAAKAALDRYGGGVAPAGAARRGLNLEEFTALVRDVVSYQEQQTAAGLATPDRVESAFRRFDTNNSGSIDARELAAALPQMGIPAHHVQAAMTKYGQGSRRPRRVRPPDARSDRGAADGGGARRDDGGGVRAPPSTASTPTGRGRSTRASCVGRSTRWE